MKVPKLLLFVACEKAIVDQQNNISLISVLDEAKVAIPANTTVPEGKRPLVPMRWDAVTLWQKTDERAYEQRIALFDPSGNAAGLDSTIEVEFEGKNKRRNIAAVYGFPIHEMG